MSNTIQMDMPEPCSVLWFTKFMALPNSGVVPTVTPPDRLPSRQALALFWGPKDRHGYTFVDHGSHSYELYVREMHCRVMQLKWPINGVLHFHFARGLLAEAAGLNVNWAEFAFRVTHPHQSNSKVPRILPEYECITIPLPPLIKVLPEGHFQVPAFIDRGVPNTPGSKEGPLPRDSPPSVWQASPPMRTVNVNSASPGGIESSRRTPRQSAKGKEKMDTHEPRLEAVSLIGLKQIGGRVAQIVVEEQRKLQQARHDHFQTCDELGSRLKQERETLYFIQERVKMKEQCMEQMIEIRDKAKGILSASRAEDLTLTSGVDKSEKETFVKMCEELYTSWEISVDLAKQRLEHWELNFNRQSAICVKCYNDLLMAEGKYADACGHIDQAMEGLSGLADLLRHI